MNNIEIAKEIRSAIKKDDIEKVKELIENNIEMLNWMTPFGTWLHVAATHGKFEIVKYCIEMGMNINDKGDISDSGAINSAASEGHYEIVKYLISCGAELDVSEPDKNPLFSAIYGGHKEIVELLLEKGIDASIRYSGENMTNMSAYDFAIERGEIDIANMLKLHGNK